MEDKNVYAITGITGQVGGIVARTLLEEGKTVRAIVRNAAKGEAWAALGCEVAVADMDDTKALTMAFAGAAGVFILLPPIFDPAPDFREARAVIEAVRSALETSPPAHVVALSTIGAQADEFNLLNQLGLMEKALRELPMPVSFLRAAWFMENSAWDVRPARESGVVPSYLQPLDKRIPMVAAVDIGRVAAELLQSPGNGARVVELEGPRRVSPHEIALILSRILARDVRMEAVPRATWEAQFRSQGAKNPSPRARMLDGFNEGWIEFERGATGSRKGSTEIETVLRNLVNPSESQN